MTATDTTTSRWNTMRSDESRLVERHLLGAGFDSVEAYRYNPASIRVRIIDPRFRGLPLNRRIDIVEPHLDQLPEHIQLDIITLLAIAPSELTGNPKKFRQFTENVEFEEPSL